MRLSLNMIRPISEKIDYSDHNELTFVASLGNELSTSMEINSRCTLLGEL